MARVTLSPVCGCATDGRRGRWGGEVLAGAGATRGLQTGPPQQQGGEPCRGCACSGPAEPADAACTPKRASPARQRCSQARTPEPPRMSQCVARRTWCSTRVSAARQPKRSSECTCTLRPLGKRRCGGQVVVVVVGWGAKGMVGGQGAARQRGEQGRLGLHALASRGGAAATGRRARSPACAAIRGPPGSSCGTHQLFQGGAVGCARHRVAPT